MNAVSNSPMLMSGIRVLDFTWGGAGPFATKALADHGAEVIKIETSTHLDFPRQMGPYVDKVKGINRSAYFSNRNSSKLGVTLNLKNKESVALAKKLVPSCDIVINNFRAGVLEKVGLGYQDVAELKPDVIYVSMPLQGSGGPQAGYSGVGHTLNVLAAIYGLTAYEDGTVAGPGTNFPDHSVNPGHALVAIMAALIHRKRTGRGQYVEVSQLESTINLVGPHILAYSLNRSNPKPEGNTSPNAAPYGVFPCANNEWIAISVNDDAQWAGFCDAVGEGWTKDKRFSSVEGRIGARAELATATAEWTKSQDAYAAMKALQGKGVTAGVVQTAKDIVERDPQIAHRGHLVSVDGHAEMGPTIYNAPPFKLSRTPFHMSRPAPTLGQHNKDVFQGMLGVSDEDMERMKQADVFK
jgi:benzylsuccinate CoA-transferase BbsF subunit